MWVWILSVIQEVAVVCLIENGFGFYPQINQLLLFVWKSFRVEDRKKAVKKEDRFQSLWSNNVPRMEFTFSANLLQK